MTIFRLSKPSNPDVIKYLTASALIAFSFFGFVVVVFNLYLLRLGYDTRFIGITNGCTPISFALTGILAGILSKYRGVKKTTVTALVFLVLSIILIPFTQYLSTKEAQASIIFLRILSGSGLALFFVTLDPYLVSATTDKERVFIFSLNAGIGVGSSFLGSVLAGIFPALIANFIGTDVSSPLPFAYMIGLSGLFLIPAIPVILTSRETLTVTEDKQQSPAEISIKPILLIIVLLCLSNFLRAAGESTTRSFFNVYLELAMNETPRRIGFMMAAGRLAAMPAALLAHKLAAKIGKLRSAVLSIYCMAGGLVFTIIAPHWLIATLGYGLTISARSMAQSLTSVVQMEIVPARHRTIFAGALALTGGAGFGGMAFLGGYLIPAIEFSGYYLLGAVACLLSAFLFKIYSRPHH